MAQYRDSVNKLRSNTNILREKIKELHDVRLEEKKESQEKVNSLILRLLRTFPPPD